MNTYRVVWECDIEAESPREAAIEAESIMHDYAIDGHRPVLDVYWRTDMDNEAPLGMGAYDSPVVAREEIDLEEIDLEQEESEGAAQEPTDQTR